MARTPRKAPGGYIYHVLNRSANGMKIFRDPDDYAIFEQVLMEIHQRVPIRILAWCLMEDHWHFVVRPLHDRELTAFFRRLAQSHAMRWRLVRNAVGEEHVYEGRFKAAPVQSGNHLLQICRFVERNALAEGLVRQAENWRWGSLWVRCRKGDLRRVDRLERLLASEPVKRAGSLARWVKYVNREAGKSELPRLMACSLRGQPYGNPAWVARVVKELSLEHTMRTRGRPRKTPFARANI